MLMTTHNVKWFRKLMWNNAKAEGRAEILKELVQLKLAKGKGAEQIADELEESIEKIKKIITSL